MAQAQETHRVRRRVRVYVSDELRHRGSRAGVFHLEHRVRQEHGADVTFAVVAGSGAGRV
jgi:hypothetical protein